MKKIAKKKEPEMLKEYDFSKAKRGVLHKRYAKSLYLAMLTPENHRRYPDSTAVNAALEKVARIEAALRA